MKQGERGYDPSFPSDEYLFRRIPLEYWGDEDEDFPDDIAAVELPDISVLRSKYAHPEWARITSGTPDCSDWGVIGILVGDVPSLQLVNGLRVEFCAVHDPEAQNYPHSEIQGFYNSKHINPLIFMSELDHIKWRELLLRKYREFLKPCRKYVIRQDVPESRHPKDAIPE
jgi:hypothetical protein